MDNHREYAFSEFSQHLVFYIGEVVASGIINMGDIRHIGWSSPMQMDANDLELVALCHQNAGCLDSELL